jgi:sugar/nucleoside kinase (ribokinase family)
MMAGKTPRNTNEFIMTISFQGSHPLSSADSHTLSTAGTHPTRYHLFTIGNALVDVLGTVPDTMLAEHGLRVNDSRLMEDDKMLALYNQMQAITDLTLMSGGSAANTAAIVSVLGGKAAYCGRVGRDDLGDLYERELREAGVELALQLDDAIPTGRVLSLISGTGDRAMTFTLGACEHLHQQDLPAELIAASHFILIEGYSWGSPRPYEASMAAAAVAKQAGRQVAFTLSALFMIAPNRQSFLDFIADSVDVVIGNQEEFATLLPDAGSNLDSLIAAARDLAPLVIITLAESGAVALHKGANHHCPAVAVPKVVDATGAGDAFAGALLYRLAAGDSLDTALSLAVSTASRVIQQVGARLPVAASDRFPLAAQAG